MTYPERAATAHFWNPAHLMPLVELVKGERNQRSDARATAAGARRRRQTHGHGAQGRPRAALAIACQHALLREAFHIIQEGVASIEDIDVAVKFGPGLRFPAYGLLEHAGHGRSRHGAGHRHLSVPRAQRGPLPRRRFSLS